MSLANTTLWDSLLPGGSGTDIADPGIDTTQVIDEALWSLHAGSRADLVFWTAGDLIQWLDEAVKHLSRVACVFVGRDASTLTVTGQATYPLPDRHVSTLHMSHLTTPMRPAGTMELEARDEAYQTTQGTPAYWYQDLQGGAQFGVAQVPDTTGEPMPVIYQGYPDALDAAGQNTLVPGPPPLKGYLAMCLLSAAYSAEGELESPDIAAHCKMRMKIYEQMFATYYGKGI